MPIQFVGQWCNDNREGSDSTWQLPSWHKGQPCEEILSIDEFYFSDGGLSCEPVRVRLRKDPGARGASYTAVVTARCVPDGGSFDPPGAGHLPLRALHRQPLAEEHERQRLTQHADE